MGAVETVIRIQGYNADSDLVPVDGKPGNRILHFSDEFVVALNTGVTPNRIDVSPRNSISDLEARVAALEALFESNDPATGALTVNTLHVTTIRGYSGSVPQTLTIQMPDTTPGNYVEFVRFVAPNIADITPAPKTSWFGATAVVQQEVTAGYTLDDLQNRLQSYGLVMEV